MPGLSIHVWRIIYPYLFLSCVHKYSKNMYVSNYKVYMYLLYIYTYIYIYKDWYLSKHGWYGLLNKRKLASGSDQSKGHALQKLKVYYCNVQARKVLNVLKTDLQVILVFVSLGLNGKLKISSGCQTPVGPCFEQHSPGTMRVVLVLAEGVSWHEWLGKPRASHLKIGWLEYTHVCQLGRQKAYF